MSTRPGTDAGNMVCYEAVGDSVEDGFTRVPVEIVE